MLQDHAPNGVDFEALVPVDGELLNLHFDYASKIWSRRDLIGSGLRDRPAFLQDTAPGRFDFHTVAEEDKHLRHYRYAMAQGRWVEGEFFGDEVTSPPAMVEVNAQPGHELHLAVREGDRVAHYVLRDGCTGWERIAILGILVSAPPALVAHPPSGELFLTTVENGQIVGRQFDRDSERWEEAGVLTLHSIPDRVPAMLRNRDPHVQRIEAVLCEDDHLVHLWFDMLDNSWQIGDRFGSNVRSAPQMFQNHAPGNLNLELVVIEGVTVQHYWFDRVGRIWHRGATVCTGVTRIHGLFQNHAPMNFNYELLVEEGGALRHHWFSLLELSWRQGAEIVARPVRLSPPDAPVFVGSYAPIGIEIDPSIRLDDVDLIVSSEHRGGSCISLATDPRTGRAEAFFLAGSRSGSFDVMARDRVSGQPLARVSVPVTEEWSAAEQDGPPLWIGTRQHRAMGGSSWGSPFDEPTMTGDIQPVSGAVRMAVLFVDTSDQRYSQQELQDATARWTNAANGGADWSASRFWPEVSYGNITSFQSTIVAGAVSLSHAWSSHFIDRNDDAGNWAKSERKTSLLQSAVTAAQGQIDFDAVDIVVCVSRNPDATRFVWPTGDSDLNISYTNMAGQAQQKSAGLVSMPYDWGEDAPSQQARHRKLASTLIHETGHTLRLGDLYSWSGHPQHIQNRQLGHWDLMANQSGMPQLLTTWRHQLGWINAETEIRRFNFAQTGRMTETVRLCPLEVMAPAAGTFRAVEVQVADGWSLFFEYRLAQAAHIGDHNLPVPGAVLITDVVRIKDWDAVQRRKPVLVGWEDDEGDGPALVAGDEWRVIDPDHFPAEFAAEVLAVNVQWAELRISYGQNSRPDPALEQWDTTTWQSPSIEVQNERTRKDPRWRNTPLVGAKNDLIATVSNKSNVAAPGVRLRFSVKDFNVGGGAAQFVGGPVQKDVPANGTAEFKLEEAWVPGKEGHYCIVAETDVYALPDVRPEVTELSGANNRAQSNYSRFISKSGSPVTRERTSLAVENPFDVPATVLLHVIQSSPLYRTFLSARSLVLGPRETREIEVLVEYGTDESERPITADWREGYLGKPNAVSIWATACLLGDERGEPVLTGGASLEVVTGRATRFAEMVADEPRVFGRIIAVDDGTPVPGGIALVTVFGSGGPLDTVSASVGGDGRFNVAVSGSGLRARAQYVPADGFGDCASPEISLA